MQVGRQVGGLLQMCMCMFCTCIDASWAVFCNQALMWAMSHCRVSVGRARLGTWLLNSTASHGSPSRGSRNGKKANAGGTPFTLNPEASSLRSVRVAGLQTLMNTLVCRAAHPTVGGVGHHLPLCGGRSGVGGGLGVEGSRDLGI